MHRKPRNKKLSSNFTSRRSIWFFALFLFPFISMTCPGQTVRVRIVDSTNERPLDKQKVSVSGINGKERTQEEARRRLITKPTTPDLRIVTDAQGEAQFELPKPVPAYIYVRAEVSGPLWDCTCLLRVSTEELIQKGFVVTTDDNESSRRKSPIQPNPGEILLRLRPTPWWMRVLWPLLIDHRR
jgi:hypothetical protein